MAKEMQNSSMYLEHDPEVYENDGIPKNLDDDGRVKRTGIDRYTCFFSTC